MPRVFGSDKPRSSRLAPCKSPGLPRCGRVQAMPPARVLTVLNLKGGVGKTHLTWLLASVCDERNRRVLLIDTDTQGNLTSSFLPEPDGQPGVEALFHPTVPADAQSLVRATAFPTI